MLMSVSLIHLIRPSIVISCHGLICFDNSFVTNTAKTTKILRTFVIIFCTCVMNALPANAQHKETKLLKPVKAYTISTKDLTDIRVTKYKLALVQVMAEMCPNMLVGHQKDRFYDAYNSQLRAFIPAVNDPDELLVYLSTQQDYQVILQNIRSWTKSFPVNENRELCVDFANAGRAF